MLRTRLFLGLLPLMLLVVAVGGYAIYVARELAGSVQAELDRHYRDIIASQEMRVAAQAMTTAAAQIGRGDAIGARREFEDRRADFTKRLMPQSAAAAGTARETLIAAIDEAFSDLTSECEAQLAAGGGGSLATVQRRETALFRVLAAIEKLDQADHAAVQATAARSSDLVATTERVLAVAIAVAAGLSVLLAWRLASSLLRPIKALTTSATAVGEGQLDREVPVLSHDELGTLAQTFNQMAAKLRAYREATQAKVLRTQRTMEATLTSAPDPLIVVAQDGRHEVRNPAAARVLAAPELAGNLPFAIAEPLAQVLATGESYLPGDYSKVVPLRVGREERFFLPRILAIGDALTEFKGAAVVLHDVTKFRLLDDAKTNLVGTVSHELKTPLTSLRMAVYLLLEAQVGPLTSAQRELVEGARDDADRLLRILDDLLDLTRLEAGASALVHEPVTVQALLDTAAADARGPLTAAGSTLAVHCPPELAGVELQVDAARLRHVFLNLLSNAAKYSIAGDQVELTASTEAAGDVRFAVRDHGPGMAAEVAARVFERFYRAPDQEKRGAGLGLAIAREIVVAHGGTIGCTSEPGRGAEFHFLLPR